MATVLETRPAWPSLKRIATAGGLAAILAVVGNIVVWVISNMIAEQQVAALAVVFISAAGIAIGGVIYALLSRFSARANTIFMIISVIFLALYTIPPINAMSASPIPGGSPFSMTTMLALQLMHIIAGAIAIWAYTKRTA
jgi:hypothetical protein